MKRVLRAALLAAAVLAVSAGAAAAGGGKVSTQYTATYTDPHFGPVACSGVHVEGKNFPTPGMDRFKCKSTTGKKLLLGTPGQVFDLASVGWSSDYFGNLGQTVAATSLTITISHNGTAYTGIARYF
jgi:hypothetical protein